MKWSTKSEKRSQSFSLNILVPFFWMCPQTYRVSLLLLGPVTLHMATLCQKKKAKHFSILYDPFSQQLWQDGRTQILIALWTALPPAPSPHHAAGAYTAQSDQETRTLPVPHQQQAQLLLFLSQEVSDGSLLWLRCGQSFTVPVLEAWSSAWCFWGIDVEPFTGEASWKGWGWWGWS